MANILYPQIYQIARPELAVQAQIKQGKLSCSLTELESNPDRPDIFELQRRFLSDNLSLVPGGLVCAIVTIFHDELLWL
jgi:hypothetical protein